MKLTMAWLRKQEACSDGMDWFKAFGKSDSVEVMEGLLKDGKLNWANWLIVRLLNLEDRIRYAIFASEQVIDRFEKEYPEYKRPRLAIEAAKDVLKRNSAETRKSAWDAARDALDDGDAVDAEAATWAARPAGAARAAWAAGAAGAAVDAGDAVAATAATWAAWAAGDAGNIVKEKIIRYGIELHVKGER